MSGTGLESVMDLVKDNDALIAAVKAFGQGAQGPLKDLADALDADRKRLAGLLDDAAKIPFATTDDDVRAHQSDVLAQIQATRDDVEQAADNAALVALEKAHLGALYLELGNTYLSPIGRLVAFTPEEAAELRGLVRQADLDAAARERWADVLNAAVAVSKAGLGLAVKLAA